MRNIKNIAEFSIYTALAFIFSYIESLIPLPLPFPGMKLGLANLVIIIVLYKQNFRYAFGLSMLRNLLNALTFGSLFSLIYSLFGSVLSLSGMFLLKKVRLKTAQNHFSVLSVSAVGGILHNIGQFLAAALLVGFSSILWYLPVLYLSGFITGILIGWLAAQCIKRYSL